MPRSIRSRRTAIGPLLAVLALLAGCSPTSNNPVSPGPAGAPEYFVNAASGSDSAAGTSAQPFRTLTRAIEAAGEDAVIKVAPGRYDSTTGERFPLVLRPGQVLLGDTLTRGSGGVGTVIFGAGLTPGTSPKWPYATIVAGDRSTIAGFQVSGPVHNFKFAVFAKDAGVTVANNTFDAGDYGGVGLEGTGASLVRGNTFGSTSYGAYLWNCADSIVVQDNAFTTPSLPIDMFVNPGKVLLRRNTIAGSGQVGIQVQLGAPRIEDITFLKPGGYATYGAINCKNADARPRVRGCTFDCALGVVIENGNPDLGLAGDAGGNDFSAVSGAAVKLTGGAAVLAIGNTWQHTPPTAGVDIVVTGAGSVRWGAGAGEIVP